MHEQSNPEVEDVPLSLNQLIVKYKSEIFQFIEEVSSQRRTQRVWGRFSFWAGRQSTCHVGSRAGTLPLLNAASLQALRNSESLSDDDISNIKVTLQGICQAKGRDQEFGLHEAARVVLDKECHSNVKNEILMSCFEYKDDPPNHRRRFLHWLGISVDTVHGYDEDRLSFK